ncbi:MAG: hypothetical protein HY898_05850 [Deltaproteobacteria bacterium]|nr:hypothetical protein [Deltaproteobacteria bacterium]
MGYGCATTKVLTMLPDLTVEVFGALTNYTYNHNQPVFVATSEASALFALASDEVAASAIPVPDGAVRIEPIFNYPFAFVGYGCMTAATAPPLRLGCALRRVGNQWVLTDPQPTNNAGQVGETLHTCDLDAGAPIADCGVGGGAGSGGSGAAMGGSGGTASVAGSGGSSPDASASQGGAGILDSSTNEDGPRLIPDADDPGTTAWPPSSDSGCKTNGRHGKGRGAWAMGIALLIFCLRKRAGQRS